MLTLDQSELETQYPVVAVFDRPHGYVVVFPGYDDPYGPGSPKAHHIRGRITQPADDTLVTRDNEVKRTFYLQAPADYHSRSLHQTLDEWEEHLREKGRTPEQEREWLRGQVRGLGYDEESG